MPLYEITAPDGSVYEIEGPEGASQQSLILAAKRYEREQRSAEIQRRLIEARQRPTPTPETTVGGNVKEFFKGVVPGAIGLAETAGTGIAAMLPEETERAAREKIKGVAGAAKKPFEAGAGYEESVGRRLGEGVGSLLPMAPLAFLGPAGIAAGVGVGLAAGAGEARERAERGGATEEQRRAATGLGVIPGGFDAAIDMALAAFPGGAGRAIGFIRRALISGGIEGATEAAQEVAQNAIAKGVYKPEQELLTGAGEAGATGAGVGVIASLLLDMAIPGRRGAGAQPTTPTAPTTPTEEESKSPLLLGYEKQPFTPFVATDGSVITTQAEFDEYSKQKGKEAAQSELEAARVQRQREADLRTSDRFAGIDPVTLDLMRRGKEAGLTETFAGAREGEAGLLYPAESGQIEMPFERGGPREEVRAAEPTRAKEPADTTQQLGLDLQGGMTVDEIINDMYAQDARDAELTKLKKLREEQDAAIAEIDKRVEEAQKKRTTTARLEVLTPLLKSTVPNIEKIESAFAEKLKAEGFKNTEPTEQERALIAFDVKRRRINGIIDRMFRPKPESTDSGVEPSAPAENAEMEAAIPEKKETREPEQIGFPGMGKPKGAAPQAFSEEELAAQEEKPFATKLTADVLDSTGLPKQSGFYKQLLGMDMADPNQQPAIANIFAKVRANPNVTQNTKDAIERMAMQAFGGLAKQREIFGPRGGVTPTPPKGEKATKKEAERGEPSGQERGRGADTGDVGARAGAGTEGGKEGKRESRAAGAAAGAARTEAPKPSGVGDRGKPAGVAGVGEGRKPGALKETPQGRVFREGKPAGAKQVKPKGEAPADRAANTYIALAEDFDGTGTGVDTALRMLAADIYYASMPDARGHLEAGRHLNLLAEGKMPDFKFGKTNANGPGTNGKFAEQYYKSLSKEQTEKFLKYYKKFLEQEIGSAGFVDALNTAQYEVRYKQSFENDELAAEAVRVFRPLHPRVEQALKANNLVDALTKFASNLLGRNAQIARALAGVLGGVKVEIVKDLRAPSGASLAGDYNPTTNTIRLDAERGMNAHALLHEAVHAAVHKVLSNKSHPLTKQLTNLFNSVKGSLDTAYGAKSLDEFVSEVFSNPEFQQKLSQINPMGGPLSAMRQFFNAVGNFLRRMIGMPSKSVGSALDVADVLIMQVISPGMAINGSMYEASVLGTAKNVFRAMDDRILTMPGMGNQFVANFYNFLRSTVPNATKNIVLKSLPVNALTDVAQNNGIPMAKELDTLEKQWNGAIDERRRAVDATYSVLQKWIKGNPAKEALLNKMISESTLDEVDPSKPRSNYKGKQTKGNEDKQAVWDKLQTDWKALGPDGQAIYKQLRDSYAESHEKLIDLLFSRISASVKDPAEVTKLRNEVYQRLAIKGKIEPYFPLMRQGDHWVTFHAKGPDGNLEYYKMAFRTSVERDRAMKELAVTPGVDAKTIQKSAPTAKQDYKSAPSTSFVNSVLKVLDANGVAPNVTDEIMRVFLDTLPESSFAQSFRKRLGTLGFMTDASEVFYKKSMSMAHQLANLEYSAKMYKLRDRMEEHVKKQTENEQTRMVFDVLDGHIKSMVSPNISPFAKAATSTAFGFTLGFNLSSALVNTTQLPMVIMPYLGGQYGYGQANKAIGAATRLFFGSGLKRKAKTVGGGDPAELKAGYSIDNYPYLDFDKEVEAHVKRFGRQPTEAERLKMAEKLGMSPDVLEMRELADLSSQYGLLSRSMTSDVLESGTADSPLAKVNAWSGFVFHHGERMNRQISLIAAYRLELDRMRKENPKLTAEDREAAARKAVELTELLNGGASANSAPLLAKNSLGKMVFMYKRYGVSMYYMLFKTTRDAIASEDKDVRAAAKRQIAGVYGMSALLAGVQGVPMFGILAALYNLFLKEDDEDDFETSVRKYTGEGYFNGALNYLTGTAIASRIGLTDLLFHSTGYRSQDNEILSFLQLVGGPVYGVADRMIRGAKLISEGEVQRGAEQVMPAAFGNVMKGYRFATEGANTLRGDPIVGDIGVGHSLAQALGFAPAEYIRQLEVNAVEKNIERSVLEKRTKLLKQFYVATRMGDSEGASEYMQDLLKMNVKRPGLVTAETILNSMAQHMRTSATMYHGITLNKLLRDELLRNAAEFDRDVSIFSED